MSCGLAYEKCTVHMSHWPNGAGKRAHDASGTAAACEAGRRIIRIASNGQRTAHSAQPVQPSASSSAECLPAPGASRSACSESTCGGHTATHQPQPVQRSRLMAGMALCAPSMRAACHVAPSLLAVAVFAILSGRPAIHGRRVDCGEAGSLAGVRAGRAALA